MRKKDMNKIKIEDPLDFLRDPDVMDWAKAIMAEDYKLFEELAKH